TRSLVQPERLAITDQAIQDLLGTGIESRVLPIGAAAPAFTLPDALTGKPVRSSDLLALGPVIVNFFRGRWCPYCVTELEAWEAVYPSVRAKGALLVAISPQLPRQNDFTVQQHSLTFPVLSDTGCVVAHSFGVAYTVPEKMREHLRSILINVPFIHGDQGDATWRLPVPATFVLKPGTEGATIAFAEAHADHRVRPDPSDVLAAI
ncbi:MAG TPA: peroxiredoxin-like family protein, partial [Acidobacteriaceae bacterium]